MQAPRRRDQEANAGAARRRDGTQRILADRLAERRGQREPVQVDSERRPAELCVVTPAEPCRQLPHARPVLGDEHLRVRRPLADPE